MYDISFAKGTDVFASVGADGSVRMFDLRSLEHSTIIYESPDSVPLLRLAWNKQDPNYLATIPMESNKVIIIDVRFLYKNIIYLITSFQLKTFFILEFLLYQLQN